MAELETLEIKVKWSTEEGQQGLERLKATLEQLKNAFGQGKGGDKAANTIEKIGNAARSVNGESAGNISSLATALEAISKVKISASIANQLSRIGEALKSIDFSSVEALKGFASTIGAINASGGVGNLKVIKPKVQQEQTQTQGAQKPGEDTNKALGEVGARIEETESKANDAATAFSTLSDAVGKSGATFSKVGVAIKATGAVFKHVVVPLSKFASLLGSLGKKAIGFSANIITAPFKKIANSITGATAKVSQFFSSIKRIALYRAIRSAISGITKAIGEGVQNLYQYSRLTNGEVAKSLDRIATSGQYIKNSFGAMAAPLINAVAPAIDYLADKIVALLNLFNQLFAKLTGASTWTKATRQATTYADATDKATAANNKFKASLLGFDEINALTDQSSGGSGGGGGGSNYGTMFEQVEISEGISNFVDNIRDMIDDGDWEGLGDYLASKINGLVSNIDAAIKWDNVKDKIEPFIDNLAAAFNSLVDGIDWENIGQTVGDGINTITYTIEHALDEFNFDELGSALAGFVNGVNTSADWDSLGRTAAKGLNELTSAIVKFAEKTDWKSIGQNGAKGLKSFLTELDADQLGKALAAPIESINKTLNGFLTQFTEDGGFALLGQKIGTTVNSWFSTIDWETVGTNLQLAIDGLVDTIDTFLSTTKWEEIGGDLADVVNGLFSIDIGAAAQTLADAVTAVLTGADGFLSKLNMTEIGKKLATMGKTLNFDEMFSAAGSLFSTLIQKLGDYLASLLANEPTPIETIKKLGSWIVSFLKGIEWGDFAEGLSKVVGSLLGYMFSLPIKTIVGIGSFIGDIVNKITEAISEKIDEFKESGKSLGQFVLDGIEEAWNGIKNFVIDHIAKPFVSALAEAWNSIADFINENDPLDWVPDVPKIDVDVLFNDETPGGMENFGKTVGNLAASLIGIEDKDATVKTDLNDGFKSKTGENVGGFLHNIWDKVTDETATLTTNLKDNVPDGGTKSFKTGILDKIGDIKATVTTALNDDVPDGGIKGWRSNIWDKIKSKDVNINTKLSTDKDDVDSWKSKVDKWWGSKNLGIGSIFTSKDKIKETGTGSWWATIQKWWGGNKKLPVGAASNVTKDQTDSMWESIKKKFGAKKLTIEAEANATVKKITVPKGTTVITAGGTTMLTMASGGFPETGQIFLAREAGPEMVGSIGRKTAVANNDQIAEGIASAVYSANQEQNALLRQQNALLQRQNELLAQNGGNGGGTVSVSSMMTGIDRYNRRAGRTVVSVATA